MTARAPSRRRAVLGLVAVLPTLTAMLVLRPAPAAGQDPAVGFFAMTVTAASTNTSGDIGAGGGLAPVDTGAPVVTGRLDSSPTASVTAAAVEPGTLYRTAAALANNEAGDEVVPVEFAGASYPGGPAEDVSDPTATGVEGPFASRTVQARAEAGERAISGVARVAEQALGEADGVPATVAQRGGRAEATATGDPDAGTLVAAASSTAATVTVADVVTIRDVAGHASVRLEDGELVADADTTYGGIEVAGVPVELSTDGLVVGGDALLPGQDVATLEDQVNAVLEAAGVVIAPISPRETVEGRAATADSGGIRIAVTTPSSAAVPANVVDVVVGQAVATLAHEPPAPPLPPLPPPPVATPSPTPSAGPTAAATTAPPTSTPSTGAPIAVPAPTASAPAGVPAPSVAAPAPDATPPAEPEVVLAGRRIPRRTALALFGGWQLLSLSTCTLAAFALRGGKGLP